MVKWLPDYEDEPIRCGCGKEIICSLVERRCETYTYKPDRCPCGADLPGLGEDFAVFGFEGAPLFLFRRRH